LIGCVRVGVDGVDLRVAARLQKIAQTVVTGEYRKFGVDFRAHGRNALACGIVMFPTPSPPNSTFMLVASP
jgi:hypothetical protein